MAVRVGLLLSAVALVGCGGTEVPSSPAPRPEPASVAPAPAEPARAAPEPASVANAPAEPEAASVAPAADEAASPPRRDAPTEAVRATDVELDTSGSPESEPEPAPAQQPTQPCWCFAWVHGPDHGHDCFMARRACERSRRERGPSGLTRACERTEQPWCERTGYHEGRLHNLGPTRPGAAALIGRTMAQLRRDLGAPTAMESGWHRFGPRVAVQMSRGRAVRVRVRVREGGTCAEAVDAEGFHEAGPPLRHRDRCEWPGISMRHRLDPEGRLAGRLELDGATLEVWRRP